MNEQQTLSRKANLPLLLFHGLGTILGAGIYVLVGKIAATSGTLAPLAFLVAAIVAGITALSYCQLVVMFPKRSGETHYVDAAFQQPFLTRVIGLLVVFTGIVSCATLANGFVGYLQSFYPIESWIAICIVVIGMSAIAFYGIAESLWAATIVTLIEISGLALVVFYGGSQVELTTTSLNELFVPTSTNDFGLILAGAFLTFYAFIGFEDMVNIVEEVKEPERTMPRAIILALLISSVIYIAVAVVAILAMPMAELANSEAPLRALLERYDTNLGKWISVISLFAIINGVLTQIIMASRVLYGMANQQRVPQVFGLISEKTKTPWFATFAVTGVVLMFALALPLVTLASYRSFIVLCVFTLVNASLVVLRRNKMTEDFTLKTPAYPLLGTIICIALLIFKIAY
ncbi:MAG: amino acid permease [Oleiphilaceae bacterium]|nr:amino acid permease [Oleiphilaceae bacterium]